jgi:hypothetical protein
VIPPERVGVANERALNSAELDTVVRCDCRLAACIFEPRPGSKCGQMGQRNFEETPGLTVIVVML